MSDANALHPSITPFDFCVPTIHGIVGHFILFVLAKANPLWVDANINQEVVGDAHETSHG